MWDFLTFPPGGGFFWWPGPPFFWRWGGGAREGPGGNALGRRSDPVRVKLATCTLFGAGAKGGGVAGPKPAAFPLGTFWRGNGG